MDSSAPARSGDRQYLFRHRPPGPAKVLQPRIFDREALNRARALYPKETISFLREIGYANSDPFLAWLNAILIAIASQSFPEVWEGAMSDDRLSDTEIDALVHLTLRMQERDLILGELL